MVVEQRVSYHCKRHSLMSLNRSSKVSMTYAVIENTILYKYSVRIDACTVEAFVMELPS